MAKKYLANMDEKAVGIEMLKNMQKRIQRKILNWLKELNGTHIQRFFYLFPSSVLADNLLLVSHIYVTNSPFCLSFNFWL